MFRARHLAVFSGWGNFGWAGEIAVMYIFDLILKPFHLMYHRKQQEQQVGGWCLLVKFNFISCIKYPDSAILERVKLVSE